MVKPFERALVTLHHELAVMSGYIERSIDNTSEAIFSRDPALIEVIVSDDDLIDSAEKTIEQMCTCIIARHTPVGHDLREITSVFKIISDLERIGDHCSDIALLVKDLKQEPYVKELVDIPEMIHMVKAMVKDSIDSYIVKDLDLARNVYERDDKVDELYLKIKEDLIRVMENDATTVRQSMILWSIARYLERMADHATNICEWIAYNIKGHRDIRNEDESAELECASLE